MYGPSTNKQQKKPGGGDDDDLVLIQFLNPLAVLRPWGEMLHAKGAKKPRENTRDACVGIEPGIMSLLAPSLSAALRGLVCLFK